MSGRGEVVADRIEHLAHACRRFLDSLPKDRRQALRSPEAEERAMRASFAALLELRRTVGWAFGAIEPPAAPPGTGQGQPRLN